MNKPNKIDECCEKCKDVELTGYDICAFSHCPCHTPTETVQTNYMRALDSHCLFCHKDTPEGEQHNTIKHIEDGEQTSSCTKKCGKWFTPERAEAKIEHCSEPDCPECNKVAFEAGRQSERTALREKIEGMKVIDGTKNKEWREYNQVLQDLLDHLNPNERN